MKADRRVASQDRASEGTHESGGHMESVNGIQRSPNSLLSVEPIKEFLFITVRF